jgi:dihydroflavonol-4-reductase
MAKHHMYFDPARTVHELGLPQNSVKEALSSAVEWFRANRLVKN